MSLKPIRNHPTGQPPIYEIIMIQYTNKKAIGSNGKELNFPEWGITESVGYYYEYETAVRALHENWGDINEGGLFEGAWIEMKYPGLYSYSGREGRQLFLWSEERDGYFEIEEPEWWP